MPILSVKMQPREEQYATIKPERTPSLTLEDMLTLSERNQKEEEDEEDINDLYPTQFKYSKTTLFALICICLFI